MYRLAGEFECKIDNKGRFKLPATLLTQFSEVPPLKFTINRGFEKHLILYPEDVWLEKAKEIDQLNIYQANHRKVIRYWYRGATKVVTDKASRILIPKSLVEYAKLNKELVLSAYQQQIEIWDKTLYEEMIGDEPEEFSELAESVFFKKNDEN